MLLALFSTDQFLTLTVRAFVPDLDCKRYWTPDRNEGVCLRELHELGAKFWIDLRIGTQTVRARGRSPANLHLAGIVHLFVMEIEGGQSRFAFFQAEFDSLVTQKLRLDERLVRRLR